MSGLSGIISNKSLSSNSKYDYYKAQFQNKSFKSLQNKPNYEIGIIQKTNEISFCSKNHLAVFIYGHCYYVNSNKKLNANSFLELFQDLDINLLDFLEGAFHIIIIDNTSNQVKIINDRLGTLPFFWCHEDSVILFSNKIKNIGDFGVKDIDEKGFITFLNAGYCFGDRTLFQKVKYLEAATILEINLETLESEKSKYWNFKYRPDTKSTASDFITDLNSAILDSTKLYLSDDPNYGIFLSGGWDSKGLLGAAINLNLPPKTLVTNGKSSDVPYSDTSIAKKIANDLNIPLTFIFKDGDLGIKLCRDGIKKCEVITDSCPEVFGQNINVSEKFSDINYILKGDEVWGWQDYAHNRQQAIGYVMPNLVAEEIKHILSDDIAKDSTAIYDAEIDSILDDCENSNWNDIKDWLYLNGRVNRYIFGLGRSDEEHIQVRRPFLNSKVLDVISHIPGKFRVQKNLYKELLKKKYTTLFSYGDSYTSSIPDYYFYMKSYIQEQVLYHISNGNDFNGLIKPYSCEKLIQSFNPEKNSNHLPGFKKRILQTANDKFGYLWYRSSYRKNKSYNLDLNVFPTNERICFRLFLLINYIYS